MILFCRREKTMIGLRLADQARILDNNSLHFICNFLANTYTLTPGHLPQERTSINNISQMQRKIAMLQSNLEKTKTQQSKVSQANKLLGKLSTWCQGLPWWCAHRTGSWLVARPFCIHTQRLTSSCSTTLSVSKAK